MATEKGLTSRLNPERSTPNFLRATGSRIEKAKPIITSRTKARGAIGETMKAAVTSDAESIEQENHTPIQSTREGFVRKGTTINVDGNVKGPCEDGNGITQGKPCIIFGPPKVGT